MFKYQQYVEKRAKLLARLRAAGFDAPAKRWPKLSASPLVRRGDNYDYLTQLEEMAEAIVARSLAQK